MKAQIIEAITEAEKQAAYEKESAVAQAELLQREAEVRAKNTITASAGVCKNKPNFDTKICRHSIFCGHVGLKAQVRR